MKLIRKILIGIISAGLSILLLVSISVPAKQKLQFGVTFSQKFSEELLGGPPASGWKQNYLAILDDLNVRDLRLIAYWDTIEPKNGKFDFADLDWQVAEAEKRGAYVTLVVGRKTPRWPECHVPAWVQKLSMSDINNYLLNYIKNTVEHYSKNKTIASWQIENEPLFPFGTCAPLGNAVLQKEIALVRSLSDRPIVLTDSGELGFAWPYLSTKSDIFGTTLYRYVHNRLLGDIRYSLIPPFYFRIKAWWAGKILGKQIVISELQAEPWVGTLVSYVPLDEQAKTMNPDIFNEVVDYAERSGFPKAYFWGAEWWYWMKETQGKPEIWNEAKKLINQQ